MLCRFVLLMPYNGPHVPCISQHVTMWHGQTWHDQLWYVVTWHVTWPDLAVPSGMVVHIATHGSLVLRLVLVTCVNGRFMPY